MKIYTAVERIGKAFDYLAGILPGGHLAGGNHKYSHEDGAYRPLLGTIEYVNILTALTVAFALAYCAIATGR
jgi:hypothetical protein